tara:strand:- start:38 stop:565 length:528 start_codon:yes stop_codon:yes gene_type:complete
MAKAETNERIPEYFYQWDADKRFPDLGKLLAIHTPNAQKVTELTQDIKNKTQYTYGHHEYAIGILTNLSGGIEGGPGFGKEVEKFEKKYRGVYDTYTDFLESIDESLEVLLEAKRVKMRKIIKLEEELKTAEKAKEESWKKYTQLRDKYEKQWEKLLKEQQEADAKKQETKKEVA